MQITIAKSIYFSNARKEMLQFIPPGQGRILEVGCGQGNFLAQLRASGNVLWGIEPDLEAARIAKKVLDKVINDKLENALDLVPSGYFDVIVLNDVLEHMLDPETNLVCLREKLKNRGKVVASVPNIRYIRSFYQIAVKGRWEYSEQGILDRSHLRFFTRKSVKALFEKCGYRVETLRGITPTKSVGFHLLVYLYCLFTLSDQTDMLYLQNAVVAGTDNQQNKYKNGAS
jgi:2-polyprenyl-3-methyl-5-hydroxy-6-metoxy-1,4-benzoquinol methylase